MLKKVNMLKYYIIHRIFKFCVSQLYLIAMLHIIKLTYDHIDMIVK